jgi:large subunit ribosomal protein L10
MPNAEKIEKVAAIKGRIAASEAILLADYRGLTVHDANELRRSLSSQAKFSVVKNTLLKRAADESGMGELDSILTGPTAVAFVSGDVVAAAKQVVEAAKKFPTLVLKGAWLDGRLLSPDEARSLADLESREVMLSKIAGMLKSEMTRAAGMFQALQSQFVGLLEAYRDKLGPAEPEAAPEPEPAIEASEAVPEATEGAAVPEADAPAQAAEAEVAPMDEASTPEPETEAAAPETEPAAPETHTSEPAEEPAEGEE